MISNEEKFREYVREYPDQVFVNQSNLFSVDDYDVEEVGYQAAVVLGEEIDDTSGSYTIHEECMSQCMTLAKTYYEEKVDIEPSDQVKELVGRVFEVARDEEDEFAALLVFMPFIEEVDHNCMILETLQDNISEKPYFQVLLEGPQQNRFWISKYGNQ